MSPFDKRSISVDESVTKNLQEGWDEKQAIIDSIRAKQEVSCYKVIDNGEYWLIVENFPRWVTLD